MSDKLLSVEEAVATLHQNILDACYDDEDIRVLISAVRREERDKKNVYLIEKAKMIGLSGYDRLTTTELIELSKDKYKESVGMGVCIAANEAQYRIINAVFKHVAKRIDENDYLINLIIIDDEFREIALREWTAHVQKRERERAVKCIEDYKKTNPNTFKYNNQIQNIVEQGRFAVFDSVCDNIKKKILEEGKT